MSLKKIYLELTNDCNMNCKICYRHSWNEKIENMNPILFQKIKNDIKAFESVETIVLGGIGEPTYAPLICQAIEELQSYELILTTNAFNLSADLLRLIVLNVDKVMISLDGMHENFLRIRGNSLAVILNNITNLMGLKHKMHNTGLQIGIQFVISKDNVNDILDVIDLVNDLNIHSLVLVNLIPQTKSNADKIYYTRYENKEAALHFKKILSYSSKKGVNVRFPNYELKTERRCSFMDDEAVFITSSGDVVPCYRMSHTYKEFVFGREKTVWKHSFGNVSEKSLGDIWFSKEYVSFRNYVSNNKYPSCIDCDLVEGCTIVNDSATDCYAGSPSCADCLWSRNFTSCP